MGGNDFDEKRILRTPVRPRRLRLGAHQWIGLPILFAIPLFALFGALGDSRKVAVIRSGSLVARVDYPSSLREGFPSEVRIRVENSSTAPVVGARLAFTGEFAELLTAFTADRESGRAPVLELGALRPAEIREFPLKADAERAGTFAGAIDLAPAGGTPTTTPVRSFVFP